MKHQTTTTIPSTFLDNVRAERVKKSQFADIPFREYVFAWSHRVSWGAGIGAGAFGFLVFMRFGTLTDAAILAICTTCTIYGATLVWSLRRRAREYDALNQSEELFFAQKVPNTFRANDHQRVLFHGALLYQPAPAVFSRWLREVLESGKRFSQRQALERGYTSDEYQTILRQLRGGGLLDETETRNGAPVFTENGADMARRWLSMER